MSSFNSVPGSTSFKDKYIFGSENVFKTFQDYQVFCLFKFIFLGSHLAENVYFWITLEEMNTNFETDNF